MVRRRSHTRAAGIALALLCLTLPLAAAPRHVPPRHPLPQDALVGGFLAPPQSAKPRVWWHWMNGNVTKEGIRRDLDWLKRIGIGGVDCIDASIDTPQVVRRRLVYMTPEWKDAFRYAADLAAKSGMELTINSSPGWSETGGPWVTPQEAMKKAVWSTMQVEGGVPFHGVLPQPPDNIGPFQNAAFSGDITPTTKAAALKFYRDTIVIAYRDPTAAPAVASVTTQAGPADAALLSDGDLTKGIALAPQGTDAWVRVAFTKPTTIQGLTLAISASKGLGYARVVEASDDGSAWRPVAEFPPAAQLQRMVLVQQTISFAPMTARYFRLVLKPAEPLPTSLRPRAPAPGLIEAPAKEPSARAYLVRELVFHAAATVHEFEKKAQFAAPPRRFYSLDSIAAFAPGSAIDPSSVVVLTDRMKPDGTLDWTPPQGRWTVLRMGYSLTGSENHPATPEATGLEVDKLNAAHVRAYMEHYLDMYAAVPRRGRPGVKAVLVDSAEIGMQNWTEDLLAAFKRLRGYDAAPWLPALTGAAVRSPADSDRFLWDFRRTIEELYAPAHFGMIAAVARERGLLSYGEAIEDHRPTFGDDMEMRQYNAIPMAAMWTYGEKYPSALTYEADILGAASVAHIYGQNLVAAESLTSAQRPWDFAPRELKPFIDMEFVRGVNRVVIHTSVHQPAEKPPGLSLGGYGQFFTRLESWAPQAKPWISYMARGSYLLQQGRFAADVAYFHGEEAPITSLWGNQRVDDVPQGYGFDFVDSDALINQLSVDHGELATRSGMRYRVLYLGGDSERMTLPVLRRLETLVSQGAIVVGKRPVESPSLADDPQEVQAAADRLFGPAGTTAVRSVGQGKVYPSGSLAEAFTALNLPPDFTYADTKAEILYTHRKLADGELYFVSNRSEQPHDFTAIFRVAGLSPEIWNAVTGKIEKADYSSAQGRSWVRLSLPAYGSAFVIFRGGTRATSRMTQAPITTPLQTVSGPWTIAFQPGRGAPKQITQSGLEYWNRSAVPGVKYFSGSGTYTKTITIPRAALKQGHRLLLDLGEVRELAEVSLNGKPLGTVWTEPFRLDITRAARPGRNVLRVKVVNLWVNRLIGDAQPGTVKKYTFAIIPTYRPDAPLRDSGLLGPVRLLRED